MPSRCESAHKPSLVAALLATGSGTVSANTPSGDEITKIKRFIIIHQENHSFDDLYGGRLSAAGGSWAWYADGWSNAAGDIGAPGWTNGLEPNYADPHPSRVRLSRTARTPGSSSTTSRSTTSLISALRPRAV
ncbi:hypothetical protein [Methylococcus capsulatus]|uniref:hypothetical protein n=1 Tax=Methylococcus capsulatus TaxID=414 RepID=UPI0012B5580C|nr:hypothetical protein [Methylococcus capsulatus]